MAVIELREIGEENAGGARLKVLGVGGCGCNAINRMIQSNLKGVEYVAINTDVQALYRCLADVQIQIGPRITRGLGAGGSSEIGEQSAEENLKEIEEVVSGAHMVFIAAGMGGGTGTGATPVVARIAHSAGAITVGVVTRPFEFEGTVKSAQAEQGIEDLRKEVDTRYGEHGSHERGRGNIEPDLFSGIDKPGFPGRENRDNPGWRRHDGYRHRFRTEQSS